MKNPISPKSTKYFISIISILYILGILGTPGVVAPFTGFFLIAIVLFSLKEWKKRPLLLVLSLIITYPVFIFSVFYFASRSQIPHSSTAGIIYFSIYSLIYIYLFRNLGSWIKNNNKALIIGLIVIDVVAFIYSNVLSYCNWVNVAEKGVLASQVEVCRYLNLYEPGVGIYNYYVGIGIFGPLFISIGLLAILLLGALRKS
jgi:hypothetical protein